jgi:homoserine dehydrogenase
MNIIPKTAVLKFGSSVLRTERDLPRAVHEIYRARRLGEQVLVIVSALGDTTDRLLRSATQVSEQPETSALAVLLATGESTAAALLGISLDKVGIPAKVLDPVQAGLRTFGDGLDAELIDADIERLRTELTRGVVVLPGFVGRDETGGTTLLGRGGSDFTALFLAQQLEARCVLVKDVDGLYTADPAHADLHPHRFAHVTWEKALALGGGVVQPKAIRFAATHGLSFTVTAIGVSAETEIGDGPNRLDQRKSPVRPLRVALLGCGTVGGGVYQRLTALPELFVVTGVAVRKPDRALAAGVPEHLITDQPETLLNKECDVVVELIGGVTQSSELVSNALRLGRHVVTANKALIASDGERLEALAQENGVKILYSAAVGGALPALEIVRHARDAGRIRTFTGVLNGTTNFILDQLEAGADFDTSVRAAQEAGYTEADPRLDLDGTDAAQKLIILARAAFDTSLPLSAIFREGIDQLDHSLVRAAREKNRRVRLVASCRRTADGLEASVTPVELPQSHPLASSTGAENRLLIETENDCQFFVSGKGAGRWPTTEAVVADLLDLSRQSGTATWTSAHEYLEEYAA